MAQALPLLIPEECAMIFVDPGARESSRARAPVRSCESLPATSDARDPSRTVRPLRSICSATSSGTRAAQPRRFPSTADRPASAQACRESDSFCSSRRRTAGLYIDWKRTTAIIAQAVRARRPSASTCARHGERSHAGQFRLRGWTTPPSSPRSSRAPCRTTR